jgi:hypothetical protein
MVPPLVIGCCAFVLSRPRTIRPKSMAARLSRLELLLIFAIALEVLSAYAGAVLTPLEAFDATGNWGYKGKMIFLAKAIPVTDLGNVRNQIYNAGYPLLVPLAESYLCVGLGHFNDFVAKLIFPSYFLASLLFFYSSLRHLQLERVARLTFTFLLASVPFFSAQATNGYADIVLAYYFLTATIYLFRWIQQPRIVFLILASTLVAMAGLAKNEGLLMGVVLAAVLGIALLRKRVTGPLWQTSFYAFSFLLVLAAVLAPWMIVLQAINFPNDLINFSTLGTRFGLVNLGRLRPILWYYQKIIFDPRNWNLVWMLFFGVVFWRLKRWLTLDGIYVLLPLGLTLGGYTAIFLITHFDVEWHLMTSAARLFLQVLPLAVFFLAFAYQDFVRPKIEGKE